MERYVDLSPNERLCLRPVDHDGPSVAVTFQRLTETTETPQQACWIEVTSAHIPADKLASVLAKARTVAAEATTLIGTNLKGRAL